MILSIFRTKGHSMEPIIKNGSFFIASSVPFIFSNPKIGDMIVFVPKQKTIVKRIVKIKNEKYFIKGENKMDSLRFEPLNKKDIIGKVIFVK